MHTTLLRNNYVIINLNYITYTTYIYNYSCLKNYIHIHVKFLIHPLDCSCTYYLKFCSLF